MVTPLGFQDRSHLPKRGSGTRETPNLVMTNRLPHSTSFPTTHVAYTAVSKALISLDCHSYPTSAHTEIYAQKTVFSLSSSLFSSVHCTHSAHGTGHLTRPL